MQNERKIVELPIEDVLPNRFQPRIKFNEDSINELAISIKKHGVIQPIVVRQIGTKYEIIAGERRYKASVLAGKSTIPAIIVEISDKDSVEIALIENVQREDLTPIEKAISYKKILDMGYIKQEELAEKIGKSQSAIANTLRLLNLSDEVQEALLENKISERHARSLLKIKDNDKQIKMLDKIITERLTVRKTDEEIDKMFNENNYTFTNDVPSTPVQPSDEVVNIPDTVMSNPVDPSLPGFMNIDQIEQQATDIHVEPPKPEVNMDQLLTSTGIQPPSNVENETSSVNMQSNKFFNFFDETPVAPENSSDNSNNDTPTFELPGMPTVETPAFEVPSAPAIETPTFEMPVAQDLQMPTFDVPNNDDTSDESNSGLTLPQQNIPAVETPTFEVPSMPAVETPAFEVPSMPAVETPAFDVSSMPAVETPTFEIPSMPAVETPTFEIPSVPAIETPTFEVPSMPAVETPAFEVPSVPAVETPTFEIPSAPAVEVPTFEIPSVPAIETSTFEIPSVPAIETPAFEVPSMPAVETPAFEVPSVPAVETPAFEVPSAPTTIPAEVEVVPTIDVGPVVSPSVLDAQSIDIPTDFAPVITEQKPDIRLALNEVRECETRLGNLGFVVDAEEVDFENMYQITFKIQK